jgi:hypothetical protein
MKIRTLLIVIVVILLILSAASYIYFFLNSDLPPANGRGEPNNPFSFNPFNRGGPDDNDAYTGPVTEPTVNPGEISIPNTAVPVKLPTLRLLSNTPVGGYEASTTATTTLVRFVDRGRGNVYEATMNSLTITTLSNTIVPKTYESVWNRNLTAFVGTMLSDSNEKPSTIFAELLKRPAPRSSTSTPVQAESAPYELKGRNFPENIVALAASPRKDKVFMLVNESGKGVGYTANFNGTSPVRIFETPITQVNVEWPEENTIAITTKGSADYDGYLYFVNPKTGTWKKILGPERGLSAKVSRDAQYVFSSSATPNSLPLKTKITNLKKGTETDAIFRTIADACVWGNFYKSVVYCGVPSIVPVGKYPDDWYKGNVSFPDKIWQLNVETDQSKLITSLTEAGRIIDAFNLGIDRNDNYLFFMNKNDLSLWSLDLVKTP